MTELLTMTREEELEVVEKFIEHLKENDISIKFEEDSYNGFDPLKLPLYDWVDSGYTNDGSELKINNDFLVEKVENEYYESIYPYVYGEYFQYGMENIIDDYINSLEEKDENKKFQLKEILSNPEKFGFYYDEYVGIDYDWDEVLEDYELFVDILIDNDNLNTEGSNLEYAISSIRETLNNEYNKSLLKMKEDKTDAEFVLERLNTNGANVLGFLRYRYEDLYESEDVVELLYKAQKQIKDMTSVLGHFKDSKLLNIITEGDKQETAEMSNTFSETEEYMEKAYDSLDEVIDELIEIRKLKEKGIDDEINKDNIEDYVDQFTPILFKSQGYKISDLCDDEKVKQSKFLQSFLSEMINLYNLGVYTVVKKFNLLELKEIIEDKKEIIIDREDVIGMFDPIQGGGSLMELELERDITIPLSYVKLSNQNDTSYGYSTTDVYGSLI